MLPNTVARFRRGVSLLLLVLTFGTCAAQEGKGDREGAEVERLKRAHIAIAQDILARLGYATGPFDGKLDDKTAEAIRHYQADNGLPTTGQLTADVSASLYKASNALDAPISLPPGSVGVENWNIYVSAQGTWISPDESLAGPLQTSKIMCYRDTMRCTEATASIASGNMLWVDDTTYDVQRWDDHELVTKPDDSAWCVRYTMRISRRLKAVTALRSTRRTEGECKSVVG